MATPEHEHVDANGLRFACVEEATGALVLLVHGFPDTPQTWDAARPALARAGFTTTSIAPNELTSVDDRDPFVGTPWHKHVPARVERAE